MYGGTDPKGFLSYAPDGRMSVIVTFGARPKPTDLSKVTDQERVQLYRTPALLRWDVQH
jgi:hypothetical protein